MFSSESIFTMFLELTTLDATWNSVLNAWKHSTGTSMFEETVLRDMKFNCNQVLRYGIIVCTASLPSKKRRRVVLKELKEQSGEIWLHL